MPVGGKTVLSFLMDVERLTLSVGHPSIAAQVRSHGRQKALFS